MQEISALELKEKLDNKENFRLIDCRNPFEVEICKIEGSELYPMDKLFIDYSSLNSDEELIVHCRSGQRSQEVVEFLEKKGFTKVKNLTGGILAWIDDIDQTLQKY